WKERSKVRTEYLLERNERVATSKRDPTRKTFRNFYPREPHCVALGIVDLHCQRERQIGDVREWVAGIDCEWRQYGEDLRLEEFIYCLPLGGREVVDVYAAVVRRITNLRFSKIFTSSTPVTKPPRWAQTATPPVRSAPFLSSGSAATSCQKNHQMRTIQAGIGITLKKMIKKKSIRTLTLGYSTRYAPRIPEMAPDAPTVGSGDAGWAIMCAAAAARPHTR